METLWIRIGATLLMATLSAMACSPEGEMYLPKDSVGNVYFSHAVVVGRIINLFPTPMLSPNSYTVTMQVDCVIKDVKDKVQDRHLNITQAGEWSL